MRGVGDRIGQLLVHSVSGMHVLAYERRRSFIQCWGCDPGQGCWGARRAQVASECARLSDIEPDGGLLFGRARGIQKEGPRALLDGMDVLAAGEIVGQGLRGADVLLGLSRRSGFGHAAQ
ncbi:hypothetical protein MOKP4_48900 [Mycobacterium avium subsp. hominissuis]|uniref:Uncharacterized protein n=9 Tax=Mycobacteriaceae TaxID=1762 RepID=D5P1M2_9MYCO|nr:hypothetical protein BWK49_04290 [Mycobacterium intracellulare subsp. chimaera]EFG80033.1 hypothetical protein HMPREF0591_0066 [Mycobacterium parascrofulaceum ATCC BAA-614]KKC03627.1 hypothetical protein WU83_18040 [Mycobacterium nebraskense]KRQ21602.1 hypothetical protein AOT87_15955 [Mycobacteroides sp. H003]KRQ32743.1 hypothetical protein AOT92_28150 [Mycobacteroides sp. H101]KRQ39068.1 hypothetical protein AOT91_00180 [Mycobacteroides sp. H092]KRQ42820.1 hypothetical protein AOT88_2501